MDLDRFFTDENLALCRLLASSVDVDQRRAILKLLSDETAMLKSELRKISSEKVGQVRRNTASKRN